MSTDAIFINMIDYFCNCKYTKRHNIQKADKGDFRLPR